MARGRPKKKDAEKRKRRKGWGVIEREDNSIEQELAGGYRRFRTGGGWRVIKKPLPR